MAPVKLVVVKLPPSIVTVGADTTPLLVRLEPVLMMIPPLERKVPPVPTVIVPVPPLT